MNVSLCVENIYLKGEKFRGIKFRGFRGFLLNPRNVSRKFFRPAKITSREILNFLSEPRNLRNFSAVKIFAAKFFAFKGVNSKYIPNSLVTNWLSKS